MSQLAGGAHDAAPRRDGLLCALLGAQLVAVALFPLHAAGRGAPAWLVAFAGATAALGVAALAGAWRRAPWARWAAVVLAAVALVAVAYGAAGGIGAAGRIAATAVSVALLAVAFRGAQPLGDVVTGGQRAFYAAVLALAAWVAARGLLDPARLAAIIPLDVPPLHARFLGAMYLSGATFMLLALRARAWREVRIVTAMVALWTGMLGLVSLRFIHAFDWHRPPTWTWFVAYSAFPIVAAWLAWRQRGRTGDGGGASVAPPLRRWLWVQGVAVTALAVALLVAPAAVAAVWPWEVTPPLAQIYSAPFLAYGLGSLACARAAAWDEVRIAVAATVVFTAAVLAASWHHRALFAPAAPASWLWFGGFAVATAAGSWFLWTGRVSARSAPREVRA